MSKEILLSMPDNIYSQMQKHAEKTNQPLDAYILEILANTFSHEETNTEPGQLTSLPDIDVEREKKAYFALHKTLWRQYPGQHVAIYNGELIDHDMDGVALSKRVYKHYPDKFVLIRQVDQELDPILHFRSPRFEASPQ